MPPDPPRGSRFLRSYLKASLNKYSCQYEHPSKNLSYAPDEDHFTLRLFNKQQVNDDIDNTGIFLVFEMQIGMDEFDHRILALLKQQRQRPEKFRPERGFELRPPR